MVVTGRKAQSYSSRYGFRSGDIILSVQDKDVTGTENFQVLLDEYDEVRSWTITLERNGRTIKSRIRF